MASSRLTAAVCSALAFGLSHSALAEDEHKGWSYDPYPRSFNRIATIPNYLNNADRGAETVSEIVSASKDGKTLVYTDGEEGTIGFVDIADPHAPAPAGIVAVGGEPTSVSVLGNEYALVGVNTSESFTDPSGFLAVVDMHARTVVAEVPLGGQPDSLAISHDYRWRYALYEL